ncbi:22201_t:CDS:2 [Cetraspora pellucida]|uniref:22201_t:CDS:1 n=1 Tax=Cetraspora pellucida TaxID=1433469 RepID=A0A9N9JCE2_9GLOM|nr:22201_t:CDS:2 [Cetraspora pellucida]
METNKEIELKDNNDLDIPRLNKYYRSAWRSLELDNSKLDQRCDFLQNKFKNDNSFDKNERMYLLTKLGEYQEKFNLVNKTGKPRRCDYCHNLTYSIQNCEQCIRDYLKKQKWTSGDEKIDRAIQDAQQNALCSYQIIEWIPYEDLEDVEYFTQGGCATIYKAVWKDGWYDTWDNKAKKLLRYGKQLVILKMLNSSDKDKNNLDWFDEALHHFTIDKIAQYLVPCHGLTKDPNTGNFMLVLRHMMTNLRNFLLENNSTITWEQRYDILYEITSCLNEIHRKDHVHRDLHSALAVVKGMRPQIDLNIPQEYAILMEQCWNATPENRPEVLTVWKKIRELRMKLIEAKSYGMLEEEFLGILPSSTKLVKGKIVSRRCFSSLHTLTNISEPKNASRVDSAQLELSVPDYEESEDELDNELESNSRFQVF